jgi:hypothetical protein
MSKFLPNFARRLPFLPKSGIIFVCLLQQIYYYDYYRKDTQYSNYRPR